MINGVGKGPEICFSVRQMQLLFVVSQGACVPRTNSWIARTLVRLVIIFKCMQVGYIYHTS